MPVIIPLVGDKEAASVDELDDQLLLLEAARRRLDIEWTETLGEFERHNGHDVFGYPDVVAYLRHRGGVAGTRARRCVAVARAALRFRAVMGSWRTGRLTTDQAELLWRASQRAPEVFPDAETLLVEAAGESAEETAKMLEYWIERVDRAGEADAAVQLGRRRFDYRRRRGGMIEGEFALTPAVGEALIAAIEAAIPVPGAGDDRSVTQRRHDAVEDVARGFLERAGASEVGGERPHINVLVDLQALGGLAGALHETDTGHVLDLDTVLRLACDSSLCRIVLSGESEVLDVGRRTRVVPAPLRRAVIARDRHCRWRGCTRPPQWCDVHHIVPWADDGHTVLVNLCLLCRYHHSLLHSTLHDRADVLDLPAAPTARTPALAGRPP
jgi:5-methylcytosine-specific restriction protein A